MNRSCACFTTDLGYAFPTLLSAIQARRHLRADQTDVVIILFQNENVIGDILAQVCEEKGITLIRLKLESLQGYTPMYARLFLHEILPDNYERILYIDGDTQIHGSLDGLVQAELPADKFMAVADPMAVLADVAGRGAGELSRYFTNLGVKNTPASPYFNSGVLLVNRSSWAGISLAAQSFLATHPGLCLFQDQSALNFAGHEHVLPLSFCWNFPIFYRNCGVEAKINPRIYHFMSKPKPWNVALPPWNAGFAKPYQELTNEFPQLAEYARPLPLQTYLRYFAQQNAKRFQETLAWRLTKRRGAIIRFVAAAAY
jgi:lipopolysaccharide biosynthesis glycosyltransferase